MIDYHDLEQRLSEALGLGRRPVAVTFRDAPPTGVARFAGSEPSGCSFWRLAAAGRAFYTVPSDHYNCALGSHTHSIPLPAERAQELEQTLSFMTGIGYIKMEEVPGIPRLSATPGAVVYAPLGDSPVDPDVVLFMGRPGRLMLLQEAAQRAGIYPAFRAREHAQKLKVFRPRELERWLVVVQETDLALKSSRRPPDAILEEMFTRLCRKAA